MNPSIAKPLPNPKTDPLIKISPFLHPYLSFLCLNHPLSQALPNPPFPSYFSSSLLPLPKLHPHNPNFFWRSCLLSIFRRFYICFCLGSLYYLASIGSSTIGSISFVYGLNPLMSEYIPYIFGSGLSHSI